MIELDSVTKDYGGGRGVFDLTLTVQPGESFGFLGPNGAGKTVTMRHLMGFVRPGSGTVRIAGLDCFDDRPAVQRLVGYLPGELVLPRSQTGRAFLALLGEFKGLGSQGRRRCDELIGYFELDPTARMGSMSKGTRQKVGLVAAFMGEPQVLLLDEPTSGLDPVMQERFVRLVAACRERGATVFFVVAHLWGGWASLRPRGLCAGRQASPVRAGGPAGGPTGTHLLGDLLDAGASVGVLRAVDRSSLRCREPLCGSGAWLLGRGWSSGDAGDLRRCGFGDARADP